MPSDKRSSSRSDRVSAPRVGAGRVHPGKVQTSTVRVPRVAAPKVESASRAHARVHRLEQRLRQGR